MLEIYAPEKLEQVNVLDQFRYFMKLGKFAYMRLAEILYKISKEKSWRAENETFDEFCTENQIGQRQAKRLIDVWKLFAVEKNLPPVDLEDCDYSKLESIAPIIKNLTDPLEIKEWIEKAKLLTRADLEKEVTQRKNGVTEEDHEHQPVQVMYCKLCKRVITE